MRVDFKPFNFVQEGFEPTVFWRPLLPVHLLNGEKRSKDFEGVVDSGAPICIFPASIGESIDVDVKAGIQGEDGPDRTRLEKVYLHRVKLVVRDPGVAQYQIETLAGFSYLQDVPLLGQIGFFDRFKVTFDHSTQPPFFEMERIERRTMSGMNSGGS